MGYQIFKFDNVLLPVGNNEQEHSPGEVPSRLIDSVGGAFDYDADLQRYPRRMMVQLTGVYLGEKTYEIDHNGNHIVDESGNRIVSHASPVDLRVQIEALQRYIGKRASLWRRWIDDTTEEQWKTARLLHAPFPQSYQDGAIWAEMTVTFETQMAAWHADTVTTTTKTFATNTRSLLVANGGSMRVEDAIIQITADGSDITNVQITNAEAGVDLNFTGTIVDGTTAYINCGPSTVIRNGIDHYDEFSLGSGHTARCWLPLKPGDNLHMVSVTGQGDVYIRHYNQWP